MIFKNKDISTNINERGVDIGSIDANFYTEDEQTASIRIFVKWNDKPVNLNLVNMRPVLNLYLQDGSIFEDEALQIVMPESGVIQYSIPVNVIKHVGKVNAKLFLVNENESIHAVNFSFNIIDSGIEKPVRKELSFNLVDDAIRRIIQESTLTLLDDTFKADVNEALKAYVIANPNEFKGPKGDTGEQGIQGIKGDAGPVGPQGMKGERFTYEDFTGEQLRELRTFVNAASTEQKYIPKTLKDSLLVTPPNNEPIKTYAQNIGDKYFDSFQSLNTVPSNSIGADSSIKMELNSYFFYTFKATDLLSPGNKFSIQIKSDQVDAKTLFQYNIVDVNNAYLVTNTSIPKTSEGEYSIENITIPSNASKINLRIDARSNTSTTSLKSVFLFSGALTTLSTITPVESVVEQLSTDFYNLRDDYKEHKLQNELPEIQNSLPIKYIPPKNLALKNTAVSDKIYTDGQGKYHVLFDISTLKNKNGTTYYVSGNGSDSNDGLTDKTPLKNLYAAYKKSDVGTIMVEGNFKYQRTTSGYLLNAINKNINIIGYNGKPKIIASDNLTYTNNATYSNVKQANRTAVLRVIDLNNLEATGDYLELTKMNDLTSVSQTANSWYTDGTIVYINSESNDVQCLLDTDLINEKGEYNIYLENVELIGGRRNVKLDSSNGKIICNDVKMSYCVQSNGNGLEMVGGSQSISYKTEISKSMMDGFNYHKGINGELPYFIEIDCIGRDNGFEKGAGGSKSNNGSTSHDGIKGIRINGIYTRNDGGNTADVNAGTETLNLGCVIADGLQPYNLIVQDCNCYYEFCKSYGNNTAALVNGTGKLYNRMSQFIGNVKDIDGSNERY